MIKNLGPRKLSRTGSHRKAMLSNMAASLLMHEQVRTTIPKAKELRRVAERIINDARKGRHLKLRESVQSKAVYKKLVEVLAPRYAARNGGYTRILRLGRRKGDSAELGLVKLVE
ncbi:MAG: 50S ribosomal protein L17 [Elusimicrobiales bacterium]